MYRKSLLWVVVVSLLGLINIASAAVWTGLGGNDSWCTGANWDAGVPGYEDVTINPVTPRNPVIDCSVYVAFVMGPRYTGDFDQSMDIVSGNIYFDWGWRMGNSGSGASIVNITGGYVEVWPDYGNEWTIRAADSGSLYWNQSGGSVYCFGDQFRVGDGSSYTEFNISGSAFLSIDGNWKWGDEGDVLMNMSGGSIDVYGDWRLQCRDFSNNDVNMTGGDIWVGGDVMAADSDRDTLVATINLKGGTIDADSLLLPSDNEGTGILNMTGGTFTCRSELRLPNVFGGTGIINLDGGIIETGSFYIDAGGTLDINDGMLVIDGNVTDDILAGISAGYITGYDGLLDVIIDYDAAADQTTVSSGVRVSFLTAQSSGFETLSPGLVTVVLHNPPVTETVTVQYAVTGGSADGSDYTLNPGALTFNPGGATSQDIAITIVNDGNDEPDETIEITLSDPNNAKLGAIAEHTYTILDPRPFVAFETDTSNGREGFSPAEIPVSLSWDWGQTVTVDYDVTGGTAEGGGEDYTLAAGTLQFDPGELTSYISIGIVEDDFQEDPDETIEITLSDPNQAKLGTITQHTFTIRPPMVMICPQGDLDGDCDVDYNDVKLFAAQWLDPSGSCSGFDCGDIDGIDGVNLYDYCLLAANWSQEVFPVVINELMASNDETIADSNGEYNDWFELYNAGPIARDIGGMYLTDNLSKPTIEWWQIPPGLTIEAGEYLVFWADNDEEQGPTHTNFKLGASGEELGLFDTDGSTLLDSIEFGKQVSDISYGLYPDASNDERFFGVPTPGWENSGAYLGEVKDTKFSHDRGFYESSFNLSITCDTSDSNIYYTLDGSEPNESVGTLYTGPILNINQTTVLRAAAFKPGYLYSNVDTQTYIFVDDVVTQPDMDPTVVATYGAGFIKNALKSIPTLSIVMDACDLENLQHQDSTYPDCDDDDCLPKEELAASAELIYADVNNGVGFHVNCGIEGHSWALDKSSFKLLFKTAFGPSQLMYPFFESATVNSESATDEFDRIVLRASKNMPVTYVGDQWTRDTQTLMSGIGSRGTFVHLYLNGTYWGMYNPTERMDGSFMASYLGGQKEDYYATNHGYERGEGHISGDPNRFDTMKSMANDRGLADDPNYETFKGLCDVINFADYTIIFWFSGFGDTLDNNYYAGMRNVPLVGDVPPEGFMMFIWDAEAVFQVDFVGPDNHEVPWVPSDYFTETCGGSPDGKCTIVSTWLALHDNEDFRMLFSDRVYKHCFNDGSLTDDNTQQRWDAMTADINDASFCELARWPNGGGYDAGPDGDANIAPPDHIDMNDFVDIFMTALDDWSGTYQLYPDIDPPTFNQHGGAVSSPYVVILTNPNGSGTVYYTLDGTDPREPVTGNPVGTAGISMVLNQSTHVKARVFDDPIWSALNEVTFAVGPVADNLRITEIMYHPLDTNDTNDPNTEYIEVKNLGPETINLNLVRFTNGIDFTFPLLTLTSGEYMLVVKDLNAFEAKYGTGFNIAGEYYGSLRNSGERIELEDPIGQTIHNFRYSDSWRDNTDGDGYSLTIIDPTNSDPNSWDEKDSWRPSVYVNGSPGWDDTGILPNPGSIVINELLAHSDGYPNDWIELHNTTAGPIDISGWFLSDNDSNLMKYQIPSPTIILSGDYIVFTQDDNFGNLSDPCCYSTFGLSENGEEVYLSSALDQNGVLTGYRDVEDFGASENGVSFGRYYKSSTDNYNFVAMDSITFGTVNAYPKVGPVVINEIMYHPDWPDMSPYNNEKYEFIELYNISGGDVNLYDEDNIPWKFTDGIEFEFPADANIPAGGYALVVKDPDAFAWLYGSPPAGVEIFGPYDGKCSNSGEKLELSMPGDLDGFAVRHYIRIDRVNYSDGFHPDDNPGSVDLWPTEADGGGKSLSRDTASNYGNDPNNWDPNTPSPGLANP